MIISSQFLMEVIERLELLATCERPMSLRSIGEELSISDEWARNLIDDNGWGKTYRRNRQLLRREKGTLAKEAKKKRSLKAKKAVIVAFENAEPAMQLTILRCLKHPHKNAKHNIGTLTTIYSRHLDAVANNRLPTLSELGKGLEVTVQYVSRVMRDVAGRRHAPARRFKPYEIKYIRGINQIPSPLSLADRAHFTGYESHHLTNQKGHGVVVLPRTSMISKISYKKANDFLVKLVACDFVPKVMRDTNIRYNTQANYILENQGWILRDIAQFEVAAEGLRDKYFP